MVETRVSYGVRNESVDVHQELGLNDVSTGTFSSPRVVNLKDTCRNTEWEGEERDLLGFIWINLCRKRADCVQAGSEQDSAGGPWEQKPMFDLTLFLITNSPNRRTKVSKRGSPCYQMLCCNVFVVHVFIYCRAV